MICACFHSDGNEPIDRLRLYKAFSDGANSTAHSDKTLNGILSGLTDLFTSKFTKTCMTSSTAKNRVERRVSRISEMKGKFAFSSIFGEKIELKNELKRVALLAEPSDVLPLPSNFTGSCFGFCFNSLSDTRTKNAWNSSRESAPYRT